MGISRNLMFLALSTVHKARAALGGSDAPVHVLFCNVDHYEPGTGGVSQDVEVARVRELLERYPELARRHSDSAGNPPARTWFFPPHYHRYGSLKSLTRLCSDGYGEIELHLHHGKSRPDTPGNLRKTLIECINEYSRFGIFGTEGGRKRYGFVHGDWALGNSRGGRFCGVDGELEILAETGCYADFTFPSMGESNPMRINSIYYANGSSSKGRRVSVGGEVRDGLMIIQGPMMPLVMPRGSVKRNFFRLRAVGDAVTSSIPAADKIVPAWVNASIHVAGRRNWIIIKTSTHGATHSDAVLGDVMDGIFSHLESRYNDKKDYFLHYVTARELYNIIKAAEAGETKDNPEEYRDYLVKPPSYNPDGGPDEAPESLKGLLDPALF